MIRSLKVRRTLVILTLAIGGFTYPAMAHTIEDCYDSVLSSCADALDEARWWQKPAVGVLCTGMLVGCGLEAL
jgi:hypothetical protein